MQLKVSLNRKQTFYNVSSSQKKRIKKLVTLINRCIITWSTIDMEPKVCKIFGFFLLVVRVINVEPHPRHERARPDSNNKLLTDFSDDVVRIVFF